MIPSRRIEELTDYSNLPINAEGELNEASSSNAYNRTAYLVFKDL
jgi:hypothetical protein